MSEPPLQPLEGSFLIDSEPERSKSHGLPLAVPHIEGESIVGLLVRNAQVLNYPNPAFLLTGLGLHKVHLSTLGVRPLEPATAQDITDLLAVDRTVFDRLHHGSPVPKAVNLLGHVVGEDFVSLAHRKVCPLCLRDSPHHRAIWNMSLLTACPEHACLLVNRCHICNRFLTWATPSVATCSSLACQTSLLEAPVRPAPTGRIEGVRGLVELALGRRGLPGPVTSLNSAMRLSFDLGLIAYGRRGRGKVVSFGEEHPDAVVEILDVGWHALEDWPHGFHSFLSDLRTHADRRRGRYGVNKEFGFLPTWLTLVDGQPDVAALAEEFVGYTAEQPDLATRATEVRRRRSSGPLTGRFITATEGKEILGVTYTRLQELATKHGLWLVPPDGSGAASLLHADKLQEFAREVEVGLTKKDVADLLTVSKETFWKIEAAGVLPIIAERNRILPEQIYRRRDVEEMLARLEAKAGPPVSAKTRRKLITADSLARGGVDIGGIISAVLDGRLVPRSVNSRAKGLRRLLFEPRWIHEVLGGSDRSMSVNDAAVALGVKQEVAYEWVRRGLLRTIVGTTKAEAGARVTQEAIEAFQKEYVTGVKLAASVGSQSRRYSSQHLMELGLTPVSGPSVDGARQFLFRCADVDKMKLRSLRRFVAGEKEGWGIGEVQVLIRAIGRAAARHLGLELRQISSRFLDNIGGTVVQVVTGRRNGFGGVFRFVVSASQMRHLDGAWHGYLALGFVGQDRFLLIPWSEVSSYLRRRPKGGADVFLKPDVLRLSDMLAKFAVSIA